MTEPRAVPGEPEPVGRVLVSELGPSFDLLAAVGERGFLMERGGIGVAGSAGGGLDVALEGGGRSDLELTQGSIRSASRSVLRRLRSLDRDRAAASPVAVGAIPFIGHEVTLFTPHRVVRRDQPGSTRLIETLEDGEEPKVFVAEPVSHVGPPHDAFSDLQLTPVPSADVYMDAVRTATQSIRAGELRKVVLARQIRVEAGRVLDPRLLAARLRAVDPDAYTFMAPTARGVMVGASPELLVSKHGAEIRSNPLAGSAPRSGDPDEDRANADALTDSNKDREEHAIVVEAVAETLQPFCDELQWDPEPVLLPTANVWHLSTRFRGVLRDTSTDVLQLVGALHPTPAVGGSPREAALAAIDRLEPFERWGYGGPVGWVDAEGDGEWAIALRCAELSGERAILFAGAGIVADSDPDAELDETERKFRAFLDSLRWG
jgi:isochorismate synthase